MKIKISRNGISYGLYKFRAAEYIAIILIIIFYILLILAFMEII